MVDDLKRHLGLKEHKACRLLNISRSVYRYNPVYKKDDCILTERLREIAFKKPRYGIRRIHMLLQKEGLVVNHKRTERIYKKEGLAIRRKKHKKMYSPMRLPLHTPHRINEQWAMDFVHDSVARSKKFRCLSVIDIFSRECLAIEVDTSISSKAVVDVLNRLIAIKGRPDTIVVDNGPEFTSKVFHIWAKERNIKIHYIQPGKPIENAYIESFQGKLRDECLNTNFFLSIYEARSKIESWRMEYNTERPHSSLNHVAPHEFIERMALTG